MCSTLRRTRAGLGGRADGKETETQKQGCHAELQATLSAYHQGQGVREQKDAPAAPDADAVRALVIVLALSACADTDAYVIECPAGGGTFTLKEQDSLQWRPGA